MNKNKKLHCRN